MLNNRLNYERDKNYKKSHVYSSKLPRRNPILFLFQPDRSFIRLVIRRRISPRACERNGSINALVFLLLWTLTLSLYFSLSLSLATSERKGRNEREHRPSARVIVYGSLLIKGDAQSPLAASTGAKRIDSSTRRKRREYHP